MISCSLLEMAASLPRSDKRSLCLEQTNEHQRSLSLLHNKRKVMNSASEIKRKIASMVALHVEMILSEIVIIKETGDSLLSLQPDLEILVPKNEKVNRKLSELFQLWAQRRVRE